MIKDPDILSEVTFLESHKYLLCHKFTPAQLLTRKVYLLHSSSQHSLEASWSKSSGCDLCGSNVGKLGMDAAAALWDHCRHSLWKWCNKDEAGWWWFMPMKIILLMVKLNAQTVSSALWRQKMIFSLPLSIAHGIKWFLKKCKTYKSLSKIWSMEKLHP